MHHQLVVSTLTSEIVGHACGVVGGRIGRGGATQIIWGDFSRLPAHLTGADHPLWIAKYDDPLLWRLIERSREPQDASTVLPLNEFWAAGRRYFCSSVTQDRRALTVKAQPEQSDSSGNLAPGFWDDSDHEANQDSNQPVAWHLSKEDRVYIIVFASQHQLRFTYGSLSKGFGRAGMVLEEMRPLRTLLSARAETGDNYLFRTPLPHMSNLTAEQLQAFKTIANVDSSFSSNRRQGPGSPTS